MNIGTFDISFGLLGICLAIYSLRNIILGNMTYKWKTIKGHLNESTIKFGWVNENDDSQSYYYYLNYTYEIDGKKYHSDRILIGERTIGYNDTNELKKYDENFRKYSNQKELTIYYSKTKPGLSVLERGTDIASYFILILGLGLLIGALIDSIK